MHGYAGIQNCNSDAGAGVGKYLFFFRMYQFLTRSIALYVSFFSIKVCLGQVVGEWRTLEGRLSYSIKTKAVFPYQNQ